MLAARLDNNGSIVNAGFIMRNSSLSTTEQHDQQINLYSHEQKTFVTCARPEGAGKQEIIRSAPEVNLLKRSDNSAFCAQCVCGTHIIMHEKRGRGNEWVTDTKYVSAHLYKPCF